MGLNELEDRPAIFVVVVALLQVAVAMNVASWCLLQDFEAKLVPTGSA